MAYHSPLFATVVLTLSASGLFGAADDTTPVQTVDAVAESGTAAFEFPTADNVMPLRSLQQVGILISRLEPKIGAPDSELSDFERQDVYMTWSSAILSALAFRETEGNTEAVMCDLAALYRMGRNLGVAGCDAEAFATMELGLTMYPTSMRMQWQAVFLYMEALPDRANDAEVALVTLRALMQSEENFEVERRLAELYAATGQTEAAISQIDHALGIRPGNEHLMQLRRSLAEH